MCGRFYTDFDDVQYREMLAMLYLKSERDAGLLMLKNGEVFPTDSAVALDATGPRAMRWGCRPKWSGWSRRMSMPPSRVSRRGG